MNRWNDRNAGGWRKQSVTAKTPPKNKQKKWRWGYKLRQQDASSWISSSARENRKCFTWCWPTNQRNKWNEFSKGWMYIGQRLALATLFNNRQKLRQNCSHSAWRKFGKFARHITNDVWPSKTPSDFSSAFIFDRHLTILSRTKDTLKSLYATVRACALKINNKTLRSAGQSKSKEKRSVTSSCGLFFSAHSVTCEHFFF